MSSISSQNIQRISENSKEQSEYSSEQNLSSEREIQKQKSHSESSLDQSVSSESTSRKLSNDLQMPEHLQIYFLSQMTARKKQQSQRQFKSALNFNIYQKQKQGFTPARRSNQSQVKKNFEDQSRVQYLQVLKKRRSSQIQIQQLNRKSQILQNNQNKKQFQFAQKSMIQTQTQNFMSTQFENIENSESQKIDKLPKTM